MLVDKGVLGFCASFAVVAVACGHDDRPARYGETRLTSAQMNNESAIRRITSARCDHALSCNDVGAGKKFGTRDACVNERGHDERASLRASECPGGIDQQALEECLRDIHKEKCDNPFDSITRIAACRTGVLCKK